MYRRAVDVVAGGRSGSAAGRPTIRVTKARELFFGGPGGFNAFHAKATHAGSGLTAL